MRTIKTFQPSTLHRLIYGLSYRAIVACTPGGSHARQLALPCTPHHHHTTRTSPISPIIVVWKHTRMLASPRWRSTTEFRDKDAWRVRKTTILSYLQWCIGVQKYSCWIFKLCMHKIRCRGAVSLKMHKTAFKK
jgi:hypothetical protein